MTSSPHPVLTFAWTTVVPRWHVVQEIVKPSCAQTGAPMTLVRNGWQVRLSLQELGGFSWRLFTALVYTMVYTRDNLQEHVFYEIFKCRVFLQSSSVLETVAYCWRKSPSSIAWLRGCLYRILWRTVGESLGLRTDVEFAANVAANLNGIVMYRPPEFWCRDSSLLSGACATTGFKDVKWCPQCSRAATVLVLFDVTSPLDPDPRSLSTNLWTPFDMLMTWMWWNPTSSFAPFHSFKAQIGTVSPVRTRLCHGGHWGVWFDQVLELCLRHGLSWVTAQEMWVTLNKLWANPFPKLPLPGSPANWRRFDRFILAY